MQILLLTLDFPPRRGGVARYLDTFARSFAGRITVLAPTEEGSEKVDAHAGYPIERARLLSRWVNPHWFPMLGQLIRRRAAYHTVVVSHVLPAGTAAYLAGYITGKPYAVMVHGMDVGLARRNAWKHWLTGQVLRNAKTVICNSKALEQEVRQVFCVERTVVAYPCLPSMRTEHVRHSDRAGYHLLTVARLVERKGHMRVLQALARMKGSVSSYTIIGDGPMRGALEQEVKKLELESVVRIMGDVSDEALQQAYAQADVFVMPTVADATDREGFGMVYIEAAAHGMPSIATNHPGVNEAVLDDTTGILVPDGNRDALVGALTRLADPAERKRLGEAARARARQFTPENQFDPLKALL